MYVDNGYIVSAFARRPSAPPFPEAPNPAARVMERPVARGMSNEKYRLLEKADDHRDALQEKTSKAMDTPEMRVQNEAKTRAREKLKAIVEKLKILKKLFSGNAKEMARAMTQVFKELKAALKEFKEAGKAQMDAVASVAASIVPPATTGVADPARPEGEVKAAEADASTVTNNELMGSMRKSLGEDAMEFLKELKAILKHIDEKMLAPARIQKAAQKPDEDTDKVFEDMDKELKELRKAMADMERDLKKDAPETGMMLDIRA